MLADDMKLADEDYRRLEQNLKYKKGREGTLAILQKQPPEALAASVGRLLDRKSVV